jgi:diaminohydroxyphosphoribosylaminopyrimidine deaminase/5-amino-6-(5-phosphoribosylamino)uracil reductase
MNKKVILLKKKGIKLIKLKTDKNNFFDLKLVLKKSYLLGCRNLLVEGGKTLTDTFLKKKLFNQFYLFQSSKKLGKNAKLNISNLLRQLQFIYKNKSRLSTYTGNDIIYLYSK